MRDGRPGVVVIRGRGRTRPVQVAVILRRAEDLLHVALRFRKRDVVDELVTIDPGPLGHPSRDAIRPGVVRGQRQMSGSELADQIGEVRRAHLEIAVRRRQQADRKTPGEVQRLRVLAASRRQELHQTVGVGRRFHVGGKRGLLRDQRGDHVRIEIVLGRVAANQRPVVDRKEDLQDRRRQLLAARRHVLRIRPLDGVDARAEITAPIVNPADGRLNGR